MPSLDYLIEVLFLLHFLRDYRGYVFHRGRRLISRGGQLKVRLSQNEYLYEIINFPKYTSWKINDFMHNIRVVFSFRMMSYIHSDLIWPLKSSRTVNYIFDISHSALISLDKSGFSLNFRCLRRKFFFEILKHLLWQNIHNWFHFQQKILLK